MISWPQCKKVKISTAKNTRIDPATKESIKTKKKLLRKRNKTDDEKHLPTKSCIN